MQQETPSLANPDVEFTIFFRIVGVDGGPFTSIWRWVHRDPAAVHVTLRTPDEVAWIFGRELLADGIFSETAIGMGDVTIRKINQASTEVVLDSPDGRATLAMDTTPLNNFLRKTEEICPTTTDDGPESIIISAQLDSWINMTLTEDISRRRAKGEDL